MDIMLPRYYADTAISFTDNLDVSSSDQRLVSPVQLQM
jgi:hypothetical protein